MVTIHEILSLKNFEKFRLVAGANGLNRLVKAAGFIDHESYDDLISDNIENEMIFSNLPMIKDNIDESYEILQGLIKANTACFAMKTTLFDHLPKKTIDLANEWNYPIFIFDDTYIDHLIIEVDELINEKKNTRKKIALIKEIETGTLTQLESQSFIRSLNDNFSINNSFFVYLIESKSFDKDELNISNNIKTLEKLVSKNDVVLPMESNTLILLSSPNKTIDSTAFAKRLVENNQFTIGISSTANTINDLGSLIKESRTSLEFATIKAKKLQCFDKLGVFKLLIPLSKEPMAESYYKEIVNKLSDYDCIHQSDLLNTAIAYVNSNQNIKETASKLYQHDNTIRYRIKKIFQLLNDTTTHTAEYETLAVAVHLYQLRQRL